MGRAPFDSKYLATGYSFFESSAPIGRSLAPVFRRLLHARHETVQEGEDADRNEGNQLAFATVSSVMSLGVRSGELGEVSRAFVNDIPVLAARAIGARQELVEQRGAQQLLGAIAGMVSAMAERASYSACLNWFQPHRLVANVAIAVSFGPRASREKVRRGYGARVRKSGEPRGVRRPVWRRASPA